MNGPRKYVPTHVIILHQHIQSILWQSIGCLTTSIHTLFYYILKII